MLMDFESKKQSRLKRHMRSSQRASSLDRNAKYDSYRTSVADERNLTRRESKRKLTLDSRHLTPNQRMNSGLYTSRSTDLQRDLLSLHTSSKDYPRWLTSQKSDLNVSGITSISETKYPIWLKNYDLLSDSIGQKCSHTGKTTEENVFTAHKSSYNETFLDRYKPTLEKRDKVDSHGANEGVLRIDPYASPSDSENVLWNGNNQFKDDQIELLILKAERTLESSNRGFVVPVKTQCSPQTEDILEADRSWEKIAVTFKSPVPVFCMDGEDTQEVKESSEGSCYKNILKNDGQEQESTLSGGHHHGPVEALKQMLFNLQTVQQSFAHGQSIEENKEIKVSTEGSSESNLFDQEMMPVNNSLQKALHHLSRLKELVEETGVKQGQESVNHEVKE
ncbi:lung adenoma susceptibility protein 2 isoform X2 [Ambystoma mexicanum]